ncbi:MAG: Asp-tRNA(Asn)/Glu-tRNA(Gln) amidotransferase subunit GatC [Gammaproteobacteria bacterium]|nr:Asp-tRNA(Asn)/Glu-tRNA(Gln) amidotransferase subunit GatC [Gammaproteobacteria bacterium]MCY4218560.1 Asp-tRNA(Asn)/Glu-tRNA(Gln) amidotransferase subunit GatC [Gammaproteobacteria bacterium]MCY4274776.1 Asp-tRNA(Asn)/Glu-tRNA(Gln) amidotransferase subunit GatC [Gammaproteobacteria bacterium]
MSLNPDQIQQLARLVRLQFTESEADDFSEQLNDIICLVEQMNQVDTDYIEPMSHPQDMRLRLRTDTVTEQDRHEEFQSEAPVTNSGLYLVPRVVE